MNRSKTKEKRTLVLWRFAIGHGESSKPSDGLHARFPHYEYDDMVEAEHLLLTEGLKVDHLRLFMGTLRHSQFSIVAASLFPHASGLNMCKRGRESAWTSTEDFNSRFPSGWLHYSHICGPLQKTGPITGKMRVDVVTLVTEHPQLTPYIAGEGLSTQVRSGHRTDT